MVHRSTRKSCPQQRIPLGLRKVYSATRVLNHGLYHSKSDYTITESLKNIKTVFGTVISCYSRVYICL